MASFLLFTIIKLNSGEIYRDSALRVEIYTIMHLI